MSINRVNISGNLTRDPEVRQTQGGTAIMSFGVAVNDRRKNPQTGQWEDVPNFIDCTLFGNRANSLAQYLTKGTKVAIEGKLRWSQWQDKSGGNRSKLEVIVDEIEFLSRQQGQQQGGGYQQAPRRAPQAPQMPQNAPQMQQGYQQPMQQQMAPQMQPQAPQQGDFYSEDIPF